MSLMSCPDPLKRLLLQKAHDDLCAQGASHPSTAEVEEHLLSLTAYHGTRAVKTLSTGSTVRCKAEGCKSQNIASQSFQMRSPDEPTTVFFLCKDCGKRWRQA